jgi:hypothetical protein
MNNLERKLKCTYLSHNLEVTESKIDIVLDTIWMNNQSDNKKISVIKIVTKIYDKFNYHLDLKLIIRIKSQII